MRESIKCRIKKHRTMLLIAICLFVFSYGGSQAGNSIVIGNDFNNKEGTFSVSQEYSVESNKISEQHSIEVQQNVPTNVGTPILTQKPGYKDSDISQNSEIIKLITECVATIGALLGFIILIVNLRRKKNKGAENDGKADS